MPSLNGGLEEEGDDLEYPLILTSSKSRYYLHSSYRWIKRLRDRRPDPKVEIHPDTAASLEIKDGDEVLIETRYGSMTQIANITDIVERRVINASHGWWFPEKGIDSLFDWQRANFNMVTSANTLGKEFGTPNLKGLRCRIVKS